MNSMLAECSFMWNSIFRLPLLVGFVAFIFPFFFILMDWYSLFSRLFCYCGFFYSVCRAVLVDVMTAADAMIGESNGIRKSFFFTEIADIFSYQIRSVSLPNYISLCIIQYGLCSFLPSHFFRIFNLFLKLYKREENSTKTR